MITKQAYEKKTLWLKKIKCRLIAFVLWPDYFNLDSKKATARARAAKRWGSARHFTDVEFETLKKHRKVLKEHRTLAKLKKALNPTFLKMVGDDQIFINAEYRRTHLDPWAFLCFGNAADMERIKQSILEGTAANKYGDKDVFFWQKKLKQ